MKQLIKVQFRYFVRCVRVFTNNFIEKIILFTDKSTRIYVAILQFPIKIK